MHQILDWKYPKILKTPENICHQPRSHPIPPSPPQAAAGRVAPGAAQQTRQPGGTKNRDRVIFFLVPGWGVAVVEPPCSVSHMPHATCAV